MNNTLITKLDWDSDFFGFKVANINAINFNNDCEFIFSELRSNNFKLAYLSLSPEDKLGNEIAIRHNGFFADEKRTYSMSFSCQNFQNKLYHSNINTLKGKMSGGAESLAIQCGLYSRFKMDPKMPILSFERMYKIWITKSINEGFADEVLGYIYNEVVIGLITLKIVDNRGIISLIGVDEKYRGKKIGFYLIEAAKMYFSNANISDIDVVTQGANKIACSFYEKNNFTLLKKENIYHFWL